MDGFMGYSPQTVFLAILLFVIVGMIVYRQYYAPHEDETGPVKAPNEPHEEEEQ
jgi:hypothetical protein